MNDLREEVQTRGVSIHGKLKPALQNDITVLLKAQRVPTLLTLNPPQTLKSLNLEHYEVLDCEPLHDFKGHAYHLLKEIPTLFTSPLKEDIDQLIQTTVPKQKVSGALSRVATIKLYLKLLRHSGVDERIIQLMDTLVKISELLYATDVRTPKSILQLHNVAWMHHELCCDLIPIPKEQTRDKLYSTYLHDLVVHGPSQYQMVCLRSANAESTERLFSQVKHVSMRATNRKPGNVLTTVLLSMQAKEIVKTGPNATQDSIVSRVSKQVPPYKGTRVSKSFVSSRIQSWQAHLERISPYLEHGGVWWQAAEGGYAFFDSDSDSEYNSHGPDLMHFRTSSIQLIYKLSQEKWLSIIEKKTVLPTPYIRLFKDGMYDGRHYFPSCNEETEMEIDTGKNVTRFGKTLRMGFFQKNEFDAWLISSTIELTRVQVLGRSRALLWRYSALFVIAPHPQ